MTIQRIICFLCRHCRNMATGFIVGITLGLAAFVAIGGPIVVIANLFN